MLYEVITPFKDESCQSDTAAGDIVLPACHFIGGTDILACTTTVAEEYILLQLFRAEFFHRTDLPANLLAKNMIWWGSILSEILEKRE